MMHQATFRQAAPQGHVKRLESKLRAQVGLHRPADNTTREQIEDNCQVEPAFPSTDEGYVRYQNWFGRSASKFRPSTLGAIG